MSVVTERKNLGFPTRLGAGDCAVLNVNAGSFANPARVALGSDPTHDMCMFSGELHAVHVEGDKTVGIGSGQVRGPYVQKFSGGAWSLVGTTLCPDADSPPVDNGRGNPGRCRIATNGTDLFVCFVDYLTVVAADPGTWIPYMRIYRWNGASWVQDAAEGFDAVRAAGGGPGNGNYPSIAVSPTGRASVAYQTDNYNPTRIFRSDGSAMFVPGTLPYGYLRGDQTNTPTLAVQSDGRVVGAYSVREYIVGRGFSLDTGHQNLALFDADSGAELRRTEITVPPSDAMPYIVLPRAPGTISYPSLALTSSGIGGYDDDKILFGEDWSGGVVVPENGAGDFTTLSGGYPFGGQSKFALDPTDPTRRLAWFTGLPSGFDEIGIDVWQAACSSQFVPANPINHSPAHAIYGTGNGLPQSGGSCFQSSFFAGLRGPCVPVCDGTNVYVLWLYYPFGSSGTDAPIQNDLQWIVYSYPIQTTDCPTASAPLFGSRHKAQ